MALQFTIPIKGFDKIHKQDLSGYLELSGGVLTGDLEIPITGFIMVSANKKWRITIDDDGALSSTEILTVPGSPIGLLLSITHSN